MPKPFVSSMFSQADSLTRGDLPGIQSARDGRQGLSMQNARQCGCRIIIEQFSFSSDSEQLRKAPTFYCVFSDHAAAGGPWIAKYARRKERCGHHSIHKHLHEASWMPYNGACR